MTKVSQSTNSLKVAPKVSQATSKENGEKFKEMLELMTATAPTTNSPSNRKEASEVGKEAKEPQDKEVRSKEAPNERNQAEESKEAITEQGSEKPEQAAPADKEVKVQEIAVEPSAEVLTLAASNMVQNTPVVEAKEEVKAAAHLEKAEPIDVNSLEKQIEQAHLMRPRIEQHSKEAKTVENLEEEIQTRTDKEVNITFNKKLEEPKQEVQNVEPMEVQQVQGSESKEAEKIYVKVSQPNEIAPKIVEELKEKIIINQVTEQSYEIELDPQNLGKIQVKVTFHKNETALEMVFSNKKTMELMAKNIGMLTDGLQNGKQNVVNVQLSEQSTDYLEQQEQEKSHKNFQQQKEQERRSDEFLRHMKESMEQAV